MQRNRNLLSHKNQYINGVAALFIMTQHWQHHGALKKTVAYPYNGILLSNEKQPTTQMNLNGFMLSERRQCQKAADSRIPFM